ncbi:MULTISPECIES: type VI secretion system lipoprotein TssJ [unclassified Motilimonas]|uniref:type VI secretion system lipoprotein TssJ n=1 Tax=unclassified Motilimonas TaxID=2643697 RepID=UPI001E3FE0D2|nr:MULTISPECIES: type VI secretion system lipoprotein TssJ [unclassified Motilimonas]MCE0557530.1 type VI secretion system lipoprotein TssJ [Motilimonas sp. E26]MDO6524586.1 type VI secretion system lipoprotein TssJ [Motilimonas sp. 1_MG-2023]
MRLLLISIGIWLLSACSSAPEPIATPFQLTLSSDGLINPYQDNDANPVVLRLYQLRDEQAFKQASYIELYHNDNQVLAKDLVSKQLLAPFLPARELSMTLDIHRDSRFIAVFAEFANYQDSQASTVIALPETAEQRLFLNISGNTVLLTSQEKKKPWWSVF